MSDFHDKLSPEELEVLKPKAGVPEHRRLLRPLPLIHGGDSFVIDLKEVRDGTAVRIVRIVRYRNNQNVEGTEERFFDLLPDERTAVIRQIHRRHVGRTVITT
jgi:hypothetical protein